MFSRALVRALPVVVVALLAACSEPSGNDRPGPPANVVLVSDGTFTGPVGTPLPAIVAKVTDAKDRPVPGVVVEFAIAAGAGTLSATRDTTDAEGLAQTTLTPGPTTGNIEVRATVAGVSSPAKVTGVAVPAALARLSVTPDPVYLTAVGQTAQLTARFTDQFGNTVGGPSITWQSLDETVAVVTQSGLVTAVRYGASTRIVATASATVADTILVSVGDASALCTGPAVSLAPGQTATLDPAQGACISADANAAYVAIPFFASLSNENTTDQLQVTGYGLTAFSGSVAPALSTSPTLRSSGTPQLSTEFEARIREIERRELEPRAAAARAAIAARGRSGASFNAVPTAAVGEMITINASSSSACTSPENRRGRVVAISQRAVIVADSVNPEGGFTDADYARIGTMFDTLVVPVVEGAFGTPGDLDGNQQRSVIFYTSAVNSITEAGSGQYVGGFFWVRDLYPKAECTTSNAGEIFYMLVPDPQGSLGNTFSKAFVEQVTIGTLAHEYQHLINASRRMMSPGFLGFEVSWLNEGLSHIAEELMFYRASGLAPRSNIGGERFGNARFDSAYASYMHQNVARLRSWLAAPQSNTPYASNDELATRGSAWSFLRYLADRRGTSDGDTWRRLVDTPRTGVANVEEVFGVNVVSSVKDWSIAMYADDYAVNNPAVYQHPSWNLRTLFPLMGNSTVSSIRNSSLRGPYPLLVRPLSDGTTRSVALRGGGSAYFPFAIAGGQRAQIIVRTPSGAAPPAAVTITVMRTR